MKSLVNYIKESKDTEKRYDVTKENALMLIKKAYKAATLDTENVKNGYTIDIRGVKGAELKDVDEVEVSGSGSTTNKEFEELAQEIVAHYKEYGDDAYVSLEMYWNDTEQNRAEPDDYGVQLRDGKLFAYGC